MNEALRLVRRLVRRWGYDLKTAEQYVLRPVPGLDTLPHGSELAAARDALDRDHPPTDDVDLTKLTVFLRTCVRASRNIDKRPRLSGVSDEENTLRCLLSTIKAINDAASRGGVDVVVLDDRSDASAVAKMNAVFGRLSCPWKSRETRTTGQGQSMYEQFSQARALNGLVYFCEDDYLHETTAIRDMWDFYALIYRAAGTHSLLYPQEHHTLYQGYYPSYILAGPTRRWRTMSDATHTFFTHGRVVDHYWDYFENTKYMGTKKRHVASEKVTTNRLTEHIPGFSPIPPVAVHLQFEELLPPFFNWRPLWEANKLDA